MASWPSRSLKLGLQLAFQERRLQPASLQPGNDEVPARLKGEQSAR